MARKLKTIARWINADMVGYAATLEKAWTNTDRKIGRLRWPGKGRHGYKLCVFRGKELVFTHNSSQTYRNNQEVEDWLRREQAKE